MRRDSLEKQLQNRPKLEDLVKEGILEGWSLIFRMLCGSGVVRAEDVANVVQNRRIR